MHPASFTDGFALARALARPKVNVEPYADEGIMEALPDSPDINAIAKRVAAYLPTKTRFIEEMPRRSFRQTKALQRSMWRALAFEQANSTSASKQSLKKVPTALATFHGDSRERTGNQAGSRPEDGGGLWSATTSVRAAHELSLLEVLCPR